MHENPLYHFKDKRLILNDSQLGLSFDEPFDPLLLPKDPLWGQELAGEHFVAGNVKGTEFFVEKDGIPNGECRLYYPSKVVKGVMYYVNGKLHGPSRFFSENGQILAESWFVRGLQEGRCFWFYPDGSFYSLQYYVNGVREGKQEYFNSDGSLRTTLKFFL